MYNKGASRTLRRLCRKHRIYVYSAVWFSIYENRWVLVFGGPYGPLPTWREFRRIKGALPEISARVSRALIAGHAEKFNGLVVELDF